MKKYFFTKILLLTFSVFTVNFLSGREVVHPPVNYLAEVGCTKAIKVFLKDGVDLTKRNKHGLTPIESAALFGHKKVVELLLNAVFTDRHSF